MEGISIIKKLSKTLPQHSLMTIYKSFMTLIMVILFMTSQMMKVSIKKFKQFNTMLLLQLQSLWK